MSPSVVEPVQVIKVKINGRCMNACRFCTFHGRPERLEWPQVSRVLRAAPEGWRGLVLINGGEPTLHPRFVTIAERLGALRPGLRVGLGTNLRLFERMAAGVATPDGIRARWRAILACFDLVQIGCDDEHRNLDVVERLMPSLREAGHEVYLNCLVEAASPATQERLRALDCATGSQTRFAHVTPRGAERQRASEQGTRGLCARRRHQLLVDCDGAIHFCFDQELERPVANLHELDDAELREIVRHYVPLRPFEACPRCRSFAP